MGERFRQWWQDTFGDEESPVDSDAKPAWAVSLVAHLVIFVALGLLFFAAPRKTTVTLDMATPHEETQPEVVEEFYFSKDPQEQIGANSVGGGTNAAEAQAPTFSEISDLPTPVETQTEGLEVQPNLDIPTGPKVSKHMAVRGGVGHGSTGAVGAVDRITYEILQSLEEKKTLVIWIFDQSGSLESQRSTIYQRFDRIYEELGVIEKSGAKVFKKHDDAPLLSAVASFGQRAQVLTKATNDVEEIKAAVKGIPNDPTGIEVVFSAITMAANKFAEYQTSRNIMIVIFSDEVGDDQNQMETALNTCKRMEIPVYVVGIPAPFGNEQAYVKWVDPDPQYDQSVQWIPVKQGPETAFPERVTLTFSGSGIQQDMDKIDSGFGPWYLTRMCVETGGIYFSVHPNRTATARAVGQTETEVMSAQINFFFDPGIMQNYPPDYGSPEQVKAVIRSNRASSALCEAAAIGQGPIQSPPSTFPMKNDGSWRKLVDDAGKMAVESSQRFNAMIAVLEKGEPDRQKLAGLRWQAGFDLALGKALYNKIRVEGYLAALEEIKGGKAFENNGDTWIIRPNPSGKVRSDHEALAKRGQEFLQRVLDYHPQTPWAIAAQHELQDPLTWDLMETRTGINDPPPPPPPQAAGGQGGNGVGGPGGPPAAPPPGPPPPPPPKKRDIKL